MLLLFQFASPALISYKIDWARRLSNAKHRSVIGLMNRYDRSLVELEVGAVDTLTLGMEEEDVKKVKKGFIRFKIEIV